MIHDYRKILKIIRHPKNTEKQFKGIESSIQLFVEKWKSYQDHPLFIKAKSNIEFELNNLKIELNIDETN